MKTRILIIFGLLALLSTSCHPSIDSSSSTSSSGGQTTISTSISVDDRPQLIDLYAINDFHGHIQENTSNFEPGLARLQTYLKYEKAKNPDGFVFLSSGDTFQETYDSSINKGEIMAKALPLLETETMTLGNHEFDWGLDIIKQNQIYAGETTFLGANIYNYDDSSDTILDFADDLVDEYKIIERDGLKIGIIGIIGQDQITSITSSIWEDIIFLEPTETVLSLSDELKGEKGCDIVIVSAHAGYNNLSSEFIKKTTSISPVTNKRYIDVCFTAHSHGFDDELINGVPFIQSGSKGQYVSHVQLQVVDGEINLLSKNSDPIMMNLPKDGEMETFLNTYFNDEFYAEKNEIVGYIEGATYLSTSMSGNLLAYATYLDLKEDNIEVDVILNNGGRNSINLFDGGGISIGLIYDALPFLNKTYVAEVSGSDILSEIRYNNYYAPKRLEIERNKKYTVACIDYLLLHKNANREYDYFPSYDGTYSHVIDTVSYELVNEYFLKNQTISLSLLNNNPGFSNLD